MLDYLSEIDSQFILTVFFNYILYYLHNSSAHSSIN